ncbi:hypothetical protein GCM10023321_73250 [Pseudonocardia eucalypti]|uniref:Uncharacterized protein n=1 Tax=Pseudonocardia eucalypti TaxID=648755 RepID=A0ABP9R9R3_9PSEU
MFAVIFRPGHDPHVPQNDQLLAHHVPVVAGLLAADLGGGETGWVGEDRPQERQRCHRRRGQQLGQPGIGRVPQRRHPGPHLVDARRPADQLGEPLDLGPVAGVGDPGRGRVGEVAQQLAGGDGGVEAHAVGVEIPGEQPELGQRVEPVGVGLLLGEAVGGRGDPVQQRPHRVIAHVARERGQPHVEDHADLGDQRDERLGAHEVQPAVPEHRGQPPQLVVGVRVQLVVQVVERVPQPLGKAGAGVAHPVVDGGADQAHVHQPRKAGRGSACRGGSQPLDQPAALDAFRLRARDGVEQVTDRAGRRQPGAAGQWAVGDLPDSLE